MAKAAQQTLESEMESDARDAWPSEDKLDRARRAGHQIREIQAEIDDLEERLKAKNAEMYQLTMNRLPQLFMESGIDRLDLSAQGNWPACVLVLEDYYRANIASSWPREKQEAAYDWLEEHERGDIIKRSIELKFGRGSKEQKLFQRVYNSLSKFKGLSMSIKRAVPWNTLTAMVKETYESGEQLGSDELAVLGATVGKVVRLKPKKEN